MMTSDYTGTVYRQYCPECGTAGSDCGLCFGKGVVAMVPLKALDTLACELLTARAALDEALKYGAPVSGAKAIDRTVKCPHDGYWTTISGGCMACRAVKAEAALDAAGVELAGMRDALAGLVKANEDWNAAVGKVVTTPPGWSDSYLDAARAALSASASRPGSHGGGAPSLSPVPDTAIEGGPA